MGWIQSRSDRDVATASIVRRGSQIVGYMIWPGLKQGGVAVVRAVVEEAVSGARDVSRALLMQCLDILAPPGHPSSIHLKMPTRQATLKEVALGLGFCTGRDSNDLVKVSFGSVVFAQNWNDCRSSLAALVNLKLDPEWPSFRQID